jgi:hypothetical protein
VKKTLVRCGLAAALMLSLLPWQPAEAGSGLNVFRWGDAGYTVSQTSYKFSNITGFWQALLNSRACGVQLDAIFGSNTAAETVNWKNGLGIAPATNTVNKATWDASQNSIVFGQGPPFPRLQSGAYNAFGTQFYSYYGGGASSAVLGWNVFVGQWYYDYRPNDGAENWYAATPSRTSQSNAACAG